MFDGVHVASLGPKLFFTGIMTAIVVASGYLMFADAGKMSDWLRDYTIQGDFARRIAVFSCLVIYFLRLMVTTFVFLKRRMKWVETITVSSLMTIALYCFARVGGSASQPFGSIEVIGLLLYIIGSYLNTRSEQTRYLFKQNIENKGRLYTEGLFKYSMHINYFGDIVLFTGLSIVCGSVTLLVIPLFMTLNFIFFIIPQLDKYLDGKYGDDFKQYARRTRKLVPWIY
jgi:steroid 5-alpha reductase family enzyme